MVGAVDEEGVAICVQEACTAAQTAVVFWLSSGYASAGEKETGDYTGGGQGTNNELSHDIPQSRSGVC
jgi:hypothetical protein